MDDGNERSESSLSFASSPYLSNWSTCNNVNVTTSSDPGVNPEILSLRKLSGNLEKLLVESEYDYTDAEIVVEGIPVGVHRCILAAQSPFFHGLFRKISDSCMKDGKPRYLMSELVPDGMVGYESFNVFLSYLYTGKLKPSPLGVSTCVDDTCAHDACGPAINYAVELLYASASFQMRELVQLVQRRLLNFVEKALAEDLIPILVAAFRCQLNQLLSHCIQRVARSDLDTVHLDKELPGEVSREIKLLRLKSEPSPMEEDIDQIREKQIRNIHKALDADDVDLLALLLNEYNVTLDDAYALHYATAYCDFKVIKKVLDLNLADLSLRDTRGHTVLHVAARRKDPNVIVALLDKGASALETTRDGKTAVAICRRLTRRNDYNETTEQHRESNKDWCIDILEGEMGRNLSSMLIPPRELPADIYESLDYLEARVALAQFLYPAEAKLAMANADADSTAYIGRSVSKASGNLNKVGLNEALSLRTKRLEARRQALKKTVETGKRFFPRCAKVIEDFLHNVPDEVVFLEEGTPDEQQKKKMRFKEIKEEMKKAFDKDMAENNQSGLSSPSSSSSSCSTKKGLKNKVRKR